MTYYQYRPMTLEDASQISYWTYDEPYTFYSNDGSDECADEFMNGDYYAVFDNEELIGFICAGQSARVPGGYAAGIYDDQDMTDIGLGLKPDLTGKRIGQLFLTSGLQFLSRQLDKRKFRLVVASFNERAIKVYERAGFSKGISFKSTAGGRDVDFIVMRSNFELFENGD